MPPGTPSFDLIVATIGRVTELERLLDSLEAQTHQGFQVLVVDQNPDDRLVPVLARRSLEATHLRSEPGLSRARNRAFEHLGGDIVAFPDDDCEYPPELLERVGRTLRDEPDLDGLTGRAVGADGRSEESWRSDAATLTSDNLWNRAISFTIFLRRAVAERVGPFDGRLGLGSPEPWSSGEEIDYLIRAIRSGARIEYDPTLNVVHEPPEYGPALAYRDGASVGYLLRKHRYPRRVVTRMLVRPAGGTLLSLVRLDRQRAARHAATLRGRLAGLRARPPS